jgi:hypothetical protein
MTVVCCAHPPMSCRSVKPACPGPSGSPASWDRLKLSFLRWWQVFNDLDTQDEADMMALASFFQTLSGDNRG